MAEPQSTTGALSRERETAGVRARALRRSSPDAERILWQRLRSRQLGGYKFRRQHPVGPYFADFACVEAGLVVELDGGQHFEPGAVEADRRRTTILEQFGFRVMRFDERQPLRETNAVLTAILERLQASHPHPSRLPQAGEGVHLHNPVQRDGKECTLYRLAKSQPSRTKT